VTDGGWQPWTARLDGSDLKPIARLGTDPSRITLSADGRTLLACGLDGSLALVDTTDGTTRAITVDPPGPTDASLSPDARRIAYSVNTLGGIDSNDIWVAPVGGGRAKKITEQPFLQHFPVWGPDDVLLYLSGKGGQSHDIWRVKAGGGTPALVVGLRLYNFEPAMSRNGDLAFSSNREAGYDIWMLPAGGGEPRRITSDPAWDGQPSFSADGTRIAYVSRRGGMSRIRIHDLRTADETVLPVDGDVRMPLWSPGGSGR
jgi:TolB protein